MKVEFSVAPDRSHSCKLAAGLFADFHRLVVRGIARPAEGGGDGNVLHQPYPLAYRLGPDLFIGPANLCRPVGSVVEALGFNPNWKRTHHLARAHAVQRSPVITFAVHYAGGKGIASDQPLRLLLSQVFGLKIASQLSGG